MLSNFVKLLNLQLTFSLVTVGEIMQQLILSIHIVIAATLIILVLIQHGKGADASGTLGSGASGTVFGSQGSSGFLFKFTAALALGFFLTSLALSSFMVTSYEKKLPHLPEHHHKHSSAVEDDIPLPVGEDS
jgi:preprotein translocase subunit SecG